jgi:type II secretory pathway pseudopilin PulG
MKHHRGYTLIEAILSIAFIGIVSSISMPLSQSFLERNDLRTALITFVQTMRRGETLARGGVGDSSWGVSATSGAITLFQGSDFATRNTELDEIYTISEKISVAGITEYTFAKITGYPSETGTTTFSSRIDDEKTITTNAQGTINY